MTGDQVTIRLRNIDMENSMKIEVFDMTGRSILNQRILKNEMELDLSDIARKGIYLYKIYENGMEIHTSKLIKI